MHIGVDLDNTVLDATSSHLHYYNQASGLAFTPEDVNDFYIYRLYGWSKAERDRVFAQYGCDIHRDSSPYPSALEILRQLYEEHQISIITARPMTFRDVTLEWLERFQVKYHNIAFTEDKLQQCIDLNVDVLIDDAPHYAEQFAQMDKPVILIEQPYNMTVEHDAVFRASDWLEVKRHIDGFLTT